MLCQTLKHICVFITFLKPHQRWNRIARVVYTVCLLQHSLVDIVTMLLRLPRWRHTGHIHLCVSLRKLTLTAQCLCYSQTWCWIIRAWSVCVEWGGGGELWWMSATHTPCLSTYIVKDSLWKFGTVTLTVERLTPRLPMWCWRRPSLSQTWPT